MSEAVGDVKDAFSDDLPEEDDDEVSFKSLFKESMDTSEIPEASESVSAAKNMAGELGKGTKKMAGKFMSEVMDIGSDMAKTHQKMNSTPESAKAIQSGIDAVSQISPTAGTVLSAANGAMKAASIISGVVSAYKKSHQSDIDSDKDC